MMARHALYAVLVILLPSVGALLFSSPVATPRAGALVCAANKKKKGSAKAKASPAKGFGVAPPPPPPATKRANSKTNAVKPPAAAPPSGPAAPPDLVAVDLGRDKKVAVMVPSKTDEPSEDALSLDGMLQQYSHLYGAGDVVWPASIALARMLAHVPSLTAGKRVLELGCGLGTAGLAAACHAGTASVVLTDRDESVLELAREAIQANGLPAGAVSTATLDWGADAAGLAAALGPEPFEVIIGADILYDAAAAERLADLLAKLLPPTSAATAPSEAEAAPTARALLADPSQRLNRGAFAEACAKYGLSVADDVLPGPEDMRLVGVVREGP